MKYLLYFISNMDLDSKILDVFQKMINDIIEVYTDESETIKTQYRDILKMDTLVLSECDSINQFMKNIDIFTKKIENRDVEVLSNTIIPHIDLNAMFESSITDIDRNNIWKYLQTFCIININLKSSLELQKLLSGESSEIDRKNKTDLKNLKKIKKLKSSIDDIKRDNYELSLREVEEAEKQQQSMPDLNQMNGIFQNTEIGKLAKEIAEGMDINSMVGSADTGDMESVMKNVMNPGNFMNLFQNINSKVQEKMSSGELTEESLSQEAQKMCGNFSDNPIFQNMMNNPDIQRMQQEMESTESTAKKNQSVRVNKLDEDDTPNIVPKNKTQARLQKKVQEKKIQVSETKPKEKVENVKVQKTE